MAILVIRGDARSLPLPDACVDLIVTSPPYYGLRSYTDGGEHYDGQLGSESTPAEYVAALVECTREWVRVLKPAGSLFVNLGDKYATRYSSLRGAGRAGLNGDDDSRGRSGQNRTGAGEKSLLGLPWRYALAACDQLGLILRAEIIWAKPNGLPESVTDRVRRAHEQVFHFVLRPRYYSAVDEIREPQQSLGERHNGRSGYVGAPDGIARSFTTRALSPLGKLPGSVWDWDDTGPIWHIPSQPLIVPPHLGVDHFASFPMELPRRVIAGWSPPGVCCECGEGRRPVTDKSAHGEILKRNLRHIPGYTHPNGQGQRDVRYEITGYACACSLDVPGPECGSEDKSHLRRAAAEVGLRAGDLPPTRPAVVLDPFGGTGTTALLAHALGRHGISVDRSADYCRLAAWRTSDRGELARALEVPKPPPVPEGQQAFDWA